MNVLASRASISLLFLSVCTLLAAPPTANAFPLGERPFSFGIGGSAAIAGIEESSVGYANLTIGLRFIPLVPEITVREGLGRDPLHHLTSIAAGARVLLPKLLIVRGTFRFAFSHQHELLFTKAQADPGKAIFGIHDEMTHRSGFETGMGLELMPDPKGIFGIFAQVNALFFPESAGPPFYVLGEVGISLSVGPR